MWTSARGLLPSGRGDTKTKKPCRVPLTPVAKITLQDLAKARSLTTVHMFLYKGKPLKSITRTVKTAFEDAGIPDFRFHDLRHRASTNLRRGGGDTATAVRIVGHKSEKMWNWSNAIEEVGILTAAK